MKLNISLQRYIYKLQPLICFKHILCDFRNESPCCVVVVLLVTSRSPASRVAG